MTKNSLINVSKKLKTWKRSKYGKSRPRIVLRSACDLAKQRIFSILCSCDIAKQRIFSISVVTLFCHISHNEDTLLCQKNRMLKWEVVNTADVYLGRKYFGKTTYVKIVVLPNHLDQFGNNAKFEMQFSQNWNKFENWNFDRWQRIA